MIEGVRLGWVIASVTVVAAAAIACSDLAQSSGYDSNPGSGADGGNDSPTTGLGPSDKVLDNAVILVHASGNPAFRLCFENQLNLLPQPDSTDMPEANVVGVDVGAAVRVNPIAGGPPGRVFLYNEQIIRSLYPPGADGPSCNALIAQIDPVTIGTLTDDLGTGVHALVVTGCPKQSAVSTFTTAQCGNDYDPSKGNLAILHKPLTGLVRTSQQQLPVQIIDLSAPLENFRAGQGIVVSFGPLSGPDTALQPVVGGLQAYADPAPSAPKLLAYDADDAGTYGSVGFRVELEQSDAGLSKLFEQSLANVQSLSSSSDIPTTYYAQASNYVLLLLGDPAPKLSDSGPDDDVFRNLHLLAVPVVQPKADGGTDGGDDGGGDAAF